MKVIDALKVMPPEIFADMIFDAVNECGALEDFERFLQKDARPELELMAKGAVNLSPKGTVDLECQYMRPEDAAKIIGCHPQYLRERVKNGDWDLGSSVKPKGGQNHKCWVFRAKLEKFLTEMNNQ